MALYREPYTDARGRKRRSKKWTYEHYVNGERVRDRLGVTDRRAAEERRASVTGRVAASPTSFLNTTDARAWNMGFQARSASRATPYLWSRSARRAWSASTSSRRAAHRTFVERSQTWNLPLSRSLPTRQPLADGTMSFVGSEPNCVQGRLTIRVAARETEEVRSCRKLWK